MTSKRRVGDTLSVALLVVGNIATAMALSVQHFGCTHDFDKMSCDFEAPTCAGYSLTLRSEEEVSCIFNQCDSEKCCCSPQMHLTYSETHNATVWKGAESLISKIISIKDSFKPRVPINVTVKEANGNFEVTWKTNMDHRSHLIDELTANVTYRKKGDTQKVSKPFTPTTVNGLKFYEINGKELEPSTTYLVSVRSVYWYGVPSDDSEEVEFKTLQQFGCTHDFDKMSCDFEAPTCAGYSLTLRRDRQEEEVSCIFNQCDSEKCCCSPQMHLIYLETHNATVWKGAESLISKIISIKDSFKPRVPINVTVKEANGNFEVTWKTNMDHRSSLSDKLTANVTYRKKGDTQKVSKPFTPTTVNGLKFYEINGKDLEPSTTYLVSVRSVYWYGVPGDDSEEVEFKTPVSPDVPLLAIIVSLSIAAVIISGAIYGCYVKSKTMWLDSVAKCPNPRLLDMHPRKEEVFKPDGPVFSTVCVEPLIPDDSKSWSKGSLHDSSSGSPQQSSGISTGSSCTSYANTEPVDVAAGVQEALGKVFAGISPISPLTNNPLPEMNEEIGLFSPYNLCDVRVDDVHSGSSGFDNKTYFDLIPNLLHETTMERSEVQMQCDSAYHPSQGDIVICADQQVQACPLITFPPAVSSLMPVDISYQQCHSDSGRFSCAEDSSLSSSSSSTKPIASCDPASRVEAGCERSNEAVGDATKLNGTHEVAIKCDENPCYGCVPASSCSFPPVDDDYQAFQNLVGQPDILSTEQQSSEEEEHFDKYPEESFNEMPQIFLSPGVPGFINNVQGGKCLSEHERPLLSLVSAGQSMPAITDSGYQSV